ncbi:ketopantoate reductase family protein [Sporosarcina soli]|uniref:2-dehydropantoate 2-reductase n=1 Tax=Sporosarcina soli TaxID=334736 RepID=A0ABW0TRI1_9BACL
MKMGIVGVGAIGTVLGTILNSKGIEADLIDGFKENVLAMQKNGTEIRGSIQEKAHGQAYHLDDLTHKYDLLFLLTKQFENEEVLTKLLPHLHPTSMICTLQNGAPEESVAEIIGKERTIGGAVGFGATWIKPGVTELTSKRKALQDFAFEIGEMNGEVTERIQKVNTILQHVGGSEVSNNLRGIRWAKLLMNATFSGMSATLGCTFGEVLDDPRGYWCLAHLADETIKVAHAQGIDLVKMQGVDLEFLELKDSTPKEILSKYPFFKKTWDQHRESKASMLQDLEKGRTTEIDYINGVVSRKGKEYGVATPFNDKIVEIVKAKEKNKEVNTFHYIDEFFNAVYVSS